MEKSYLTGSSGSKRLSCAVISRAIFQSACFLAVKPNNLHIRWIWASTGITSLDGDMLFQTPRSMPSSGRTIQRRYMQRRLQALPDSGEGKRKLKYEFTGGAGVLNTGV